MRNFVNPILQGAIFRLLTTIILLAALWVGVYWVL
ncbi:MAG: hypothetical protein ACD_16C00190G0014 [uncultured bacterium]|nr:MAG: hypothetical protein ACD_16C00190G0014 [uncultured bacterium]